MLYSQRLKASFVYLLWWETKLFIKDDGPSTLIDFIDGWVPNVGGVVFLYILLNNFLFQ